MSSCVYIMSVCWVQCGHNESPGRFWDDSRSSWIPDTALMPFLSSSIRKRKNIYIKSLQQIVLWLSYTLSMIINDYHLYIFISLTLIFTLLLVLHLQGAKVCVRGSSNGQLQTNRPPISDFTTGSSGKNLYFAGRKIVFCVALFCFLHCSAAYTVRKKVTTWASWKAISHTNWISIIYRMWTKVLEQVRLGLALWACAASSPISMFCCMILVHLAQSHTKPDNKAAGFTEQLTGGQPPRCVWRADSTNGKRSSWTVAGKQKTFYGTNCYFSIINDYRSIILQKPNCTTCAVNNERSRLKKICQIYRSW